MIEKQLLLKANYLSLFIHFYTTYEEMLYPRLLEEVTHDQVVYILVFY